MSQTAFAYRNYSDLNVKVSMLLLDGKDFTSSINEDSSKIDLTGLTIDWNTMSFKISVSDSHERLNGCLRTTPVRETISDLRTCIRIICAETHYRKGIILEDRKDDGRGGVSWNGTISIERKDVYSKIKMDAFVCRDGTYEEEDDDYATETGQRIMFAGEDQHNWTINTDKTESSDIGSLLKGTWESFKNHSHLKHKKDCGKLDWFLDLYDSSAPALLLNSDSKEFEKALEPRGTEGSKAKSCRIVMESQIACNVKLQLITASLNYFRQFEDINEVEGTNKLYWDVLEWLKQNLWPQKELQEILEDYEDQARTSAMVGEISAFLQIEEENQKGLRNLVKSVNI